MTAILPTFPITRMRRLRQHPGVRDLVRETQLTMHDMVLPLFIRHGSNVRHAIQSMPGHYQISVDQLKAEIDEIVALGIPAVLLFGLPEHKDDKGSDALHDHGIVQQGIRAIKALAPDLLVIADLCCCEYTSHGHCGVISERTGKKDVDNDATLPLLAEQAISLCKAGADIIAPSGMIDGMVQAVRGGLDSHGFTHIPIMSYAAKYASALYGPFRDATEGAPSFGDRRSHQIDPANLHEAVRETAVDIAEGADIVMVKPAHAYLDVIYAVKQRFPEIPMAAYHVSGEFAMLKAAVANGWLDEQRVVMEILTGIKRAGADIIINYHVKDVARWLAQ